MKDAAGQVCRGKAPLCSVSGGSDGVQCWARRARRERVRCGGGVLLVDGGEQQSGRVEDLKLLRLSGLARSCRLFWRHGLLAKALRATIEDCGVNDSHTKLHSSRCAVSAGSVCVVSSGKMGEGENAGGALSSSRSLSRTTRWLSRESHTPERDCLSCRASPSCGNFAERHGCKLAWKACLGRVSLAPWSYSYPIEDHQPSPSSAYTRSELRSQ